MMFRGYDKPICSTIFFVFFFPLLLANVKVKKLKLMPSFFLIRFSIQTLINAGNLMALLLQHPL